MTTMNRPVNAYAAIALETGVAAANPHKLVMMLFEGALLSLMEAKRYIQHKEIAKKGQSISKAIQIIDEGLKASLDENAGGMIATNLRELYDYMCRRLLFANLQNQIEPIVEVHDLLDQLKGAWQKIGNSEATTINRAATNYARI